MKQQSLSPQPRRGAPGNHRLAAAVDRERARIGRDLHDSVGQQLTGVALRMAALSEDTEPGERRREIDGIIAMLSEAIAETRTVSAGLRPLRAGHRGLPVALGVLAARTTDSGVTCRLTCAAAVSIRSVELATGLFRIAQEAVSNALRHAAPRLISISLRQSRSETTLMVRDRGGASLKRGRTGQGMKNMRFRAAEIGGRLTVVDGRHGREVRCTVPVPAETAV